MSSDALARILNKHMEQLQVFEWEDGEWREKMLEVIQAGLDKRRV